MDYSPYALDKEKPDFVASALYDSELGGRYAAEYIAKLDFADRIRHVLVICGITQTTRQLAFESRLVELLPGRKIIFQNGKFDRSASARITKRIVEKLLRASTPIDVIFCTSEKMTLGCLDGLNETEVLRGREEPFVIGYDGTSLLKEAANQNGSRLWQIIEQDPVELGTEAVNLLHRLMSGERSIEDNLMKPSCYFEADWTVKPIVPMLNQGQSAAPSEKRAVG